MNRPAQRKRERYHHGELRAALIDTAVELVAERGVRNFSLAEASRRLGVAVSAPYAHFSDRDELLAAVAVHAYERFHAQLAAEIGRVEEPTERVAAVARAYVRFAGTQRALFEVLVEAGLDKDRHPEIEAAEKPVDDMFLDCVHALGDTDEAKDRELAIAVEAAAHGYATFLLDGDFGEGHEAVELAAERAARTTRALVEGRHLLGA